MIACNEIQAALDEFGVTHVDNMVEMHAHIENCEQCSAYRYAALALEVQMANLAERSAPDKLLRKVMNALPNTSEEDKSKGRRKGSYFAAVAAAFTIFVAGSIIVSMFQLNPRSMRKVVDIPDYGEEIIISSEDEEFNEGLGFSRKGGEPAKNRREALKEKSQPLKDIGTAPAEKKPSSQSKAQAKPKLYKSPPVAFSRVESGMADPDTSVEEQVAATGPSFSGLKQEMATGKLYEQDDALKQNQAVLSLLAPPPEDFSTLSKSEGRRSFDYKKTDKKKRVKLIQPPLSRSATGNIGYEAAEPAVTEESIVSTFTDSPAATSDSITYSSAQRFFADLQSLQGLRFQTAQGYWANTYIPGDPAMRLLHKRLDSWDRAQAQQLLGSHATMDQLVRQYHQPFDPPGRSALAVYLHSDHAAVNAPTRLRLQVGIQASERLSGHRPALNVGIILDLGNPPDKNQMHQLRTLVDTLKSLKQPGDHFSITVSGEQGGTWVEPDDFRHGPIRLAFEKLQSRRISATGDTTELLLTEAIAQVADSLRLTDDPSSTLGSSSILLISNRQQWDNIEQLERQVHNNAVNGITLSAVSLKGAFEDLGKLVLAGQGNRWSVHSVDMAKRVTHKELLSSSRAVARAVRLKIRLGKNVKLIEVIDSQKLSSQRAQRVREAEQSIDQRLSRNMGITADRGKDEDGIQIVIPHFYAGDSHVILLDVVAPGPGDIADVSVKYKDLLYMRNGNAQAHLQIKQGNQAKGPMQYKVLKNLLASRLAATIKQTRLLISRGQLPLAIERLTEMRDLFTDLRELVSGWRNDFELNEDIKLLSQFITVLNSPLYANEQQRRYLLDALQYSGWRKLVSQHE